MKTLYFDCACGASGDMILGALLDAGADLGTVREALDSLGVAGYSVDTQRVNKQGIMATQFRVLVDGAAPDVDGHGPEHGHTHAHSHGHGHTHGHSHGHGHTYDRDHDHEHEHEHSHGHEHAHTHAHRHGHEPHRHLADILEILERGDLPGPVRAASEATFRLIAEAEAEVHGTTVDHIHFHEVGAIDSIVDVIGGQMALYLMGVERVVASPLNLGSGTVKCDHGIMPVPAPATAKLVRDMPVYGSAVPHELVTPTGAALIKIMAHGYGPLPAMRIAREGYGSGTRDLADRANVLRVFVGDALDDVAGDVVTVMEAAIDDMNPELYPALIEALLAAGARDVFLAPGLGKKGRPAHMATVLCTPSDAHALAAVLFRESTTIGLRMREERRLVLPRDWASVTTPWGSIRVKVTRFEGAVSTAMPEYEDCRAAASQAGVPVRRVYEAAWAAAQELAKHG